MLSWDSLVCFILTAGLFDLFMNNELKSDNRVVDISLEDIH